MLLAFKEYSNSKAIANFVVNESIVSFIGDLNIKADKVIRDLNANIVADRKKFESIEPLHIRSHLPLLLSSILDVTLEPIITDKDNIFSVINNKQYLYKMFNV
jgi:hypothetical protein